MPLFGRSRNTPLVPAGALGYLELFGHYAWDIQRTDTDQAVLTLGRLQFDPSAQGRQAEAAEELYSAARSQGGWALYGAWTAVHAFLPDAADSAAYDSIRDDSLRFIRGLGMSLHVVRQHLRFDARSRYDELFPGELP